MATKFKNIITLKLKDFDIDQIANSGQCFRINQINENSWEVPAFGKILTLQKIGNGVYDFHCSEEDFFETWEKYFDLKRDYGKIKLEIMKSNDPYLIAAIKYGYGIRILNQDLWEVIISFIISQRNNIARIKSSIKKLCQPYCGVFPKPEILAQYSENDFRNLGFGYRSAYLSDISKAVTQGNLDLNALKNMNYNEAIFCLKKFNGIGDKVANCIALFGLNKIEAFPKDVWINRIICERYQGNFPIERFYGYAGIVQQYMFFYQRFLGR